MTRSYQWTHNVLAGGAGYTYPPVTWLPTVAEHRAQFNPDYSLVPSSTYRGAATDKLDLGASLPLSSSSALSASPGPPGLPRIQGR